MALSKFARERDDVSDPNNGSPLDLQRPAVRPRHLHLAREVEVGVGALQKPRLGAPLRLSDSDRGDPLHEPLGGRASALGEQEPLRADIVALVLVGGGQLPLALGQPVAEHPVGDTDLGGGDLRLGSAPEQPGELFDQLRGDLLAPPLLPGAPAGLLAHSPAGHRFSSRSLVHRSARRVPSARPSGDA